MSGEGHSLASVTRVDELVGVAAMSAVAREWIDLHARCRAATPFSHPAWLLSWARHLATATPFLVAVRRDAQLVGLVALHLDGDGVVELAGAPVSDYRDALIADDADADVASLLLAGALERARAGRCELADLPESSPLLRAPAPRGWREERAASAVCPVTTLAPGRTLADVMSARLRADLPRFRSRLERRGVVTRLTASPDDCERWIDRLIALHTAAWRSRGGPGVLADVRVQRLHREAAPRLAAAGALALTALLLDGEPIAIVYALRRGPRLYSYLAGFAPSLARYSVGSIALGAALERACRDGVREIDFLRGAEPYKYRWGACDRVTMRRTLTRHERCAH